MQIGVKIGKKQKQDKAGCSCVIFTQLSRPGFARNGIPVCVKTADYIRFLFWKTLAILIDIILVEM